MGRKQHVTQKKKCYTKWTDPKYENVNLHGIERVTYRDLGTYTCSQNKSNPWDLNIESCNMRVWEHFVCDFHLIFHIFIESNRIFSCLVICSGDLSEK